MKIFHAGEPSPAVRNLRRIARHYGIDAESIDLAGKGSLAAALEGASGGPGEGWVLDVESLGAMAGPGNPDEAAAAIAKSGAHVLLLVTGGGENTVALLRALSSGALVDVARAANASTVRFPSSAARLNAELASQEYPRAKKESLTLATPHGGAVETVMELEGNPAFVHLRAGDTRIFAWSTTEVFDIEKPLEAELEFETATDEYIPAIIFLRTAFGERCWHNPLQDAGFVIDDPLLQDRYGFIDFPALLASAREHRYRVTLAFIPWNHRRTRPRDVTRFLDHSDCFGVCVHGCDHNNNEYGTADYDLLLAKNRRAISRMESHEDRTGMVFEPLVVCPQEQCSKEGWRAFADCPELLAMVNTGCMPRNLTGPETCGADLLTPAQDAFFGFPVLKRHYPSDMAPFAMALFLGKPAILVEHHGFFKDGLAPIESFVESLRDMAPAINWRPLSTVARECHLRKIESPQRREVRFFAREFDLRDHGGATCLMKKRFPDPSRVRAITVDGGATDFEVRGDFVRFEANPEGESTVRIAVEYHPVEPAKAYSFGLKYQAGVALRRGMSEFRDNVVARHPKILRAGKSLMSALGVSGR